MKEKIISTIYIILITIVIFILDFILHPGAAIGILYLIPLTIAFKRNLEYVILYSVVTSLLIIIDGILFFSSQSHYSTIMDGAVSIVTIWLTTFISLRYKTLKIKNELQKEQHLKSIIELLFITSHKLRRPVCSLQGMEKLLYLHNPSTEDLKKITSYMKESINELDVFTKELTHYLCEIKTHEERD